MHLAFFANEVRKKVPNAFIEIEDSETKDGYVIAKLKWKNANDFLRNYFANIGKPLSETDVLIDTMRIKETLDGDCFSFDWGSPDLNTEKLKLASITEENVINGFVQFWLQDFKLRRGYLNNLHVDIKYKKQGIGSALLKASAEIMISEGIDEMFLFCEEHNTQARMFYDHLGFEFCGLDWDDGDDRLYPNCKLKIKNNILSPEIKPLNRTYKEMLMKVITDRFCLFGAGIYGNQFFSMFGDRYLPENIFDTNPLKIGQSINGIPIIEPCQTELPILVTSMYYSEIKKRLKGMCSSKIIPFHPWVY